MSDAFNMRLVKKKERPTFRATFTCSFVQNSMSFSIYNANSVRKSIESINILQTAQ